MCDGEAAQQLCVACEQEDAAVGGSGVRQRGGAQAGNRGVGRHAGEQAGSSAAHGASGREGEAAETGSVVGSGGGQAAVGAKLDSACGKTSNGRCEAHAEWWRSTVLADEVVRLLEARDRPIRPGPASERRRLRR